MTPYDEEGFDFDAQDTKPQGAPQALTGEYPLRIVAAVPKIGKEEPHNRYVSVNFVVAAGEHKDRKVNFHNVTFLPPGHKARGMALHFLKCINQPYEGAFKVVPANWINQVLVGKLGPDDKGYTAVKAVMPYTGEAIPQENAGMVPADVEAAPF